MITQGQTQAAPPAPIFFTGCDMVAVPRRRRASHDHGHGHAHAHPRRREVVVNGKRVKTIDVHAHCCVPKAMAVIGHPLEAPACRWMTRRRASQRWTRRASMSRRSASIPTGTRPAARIGRVDSASRTRPWSNFAAQPDRFVGYATAALQHPELAAEQVEHAVKKLGFRGSALAAASRARNWPIRASIPSGKSARNLACLSSCTLPVRASSSPADGWEAMACSPTPSAIHSRPRSRCRT